jgi:anthranilate synthase/aminodeoxychorismate synthase-like glutamine amidotransferase
MKVLVIDNYDSFTYNLVQLVGDLGAEVVAFRNDQISLAQIAACAPDRLLLSPGPGRPEDSGICPELIRAFAGKIPILGVCLGHQCIAEVFGGKVERAAQLMHGKTSPVTHDGQTIFDSLPNPFTGMRYHSLLVTKLPACIQASAWSPDGELMGLRHLRFPVEGVQFHPESILTQEGRRMLAAFLAPTYPALWPRPQLRPAAVRGC